MWLRAAGRGLGWESGAGWGQLQVGVNDAISVAGACVHLTQSTRSSTLEQLWGTARQRASGRACCLWGHLCCCFCWGHKGGGTGALAVRLCTV